MMLAIDVEDDRAERWKELVPWNAFVFPFQAITYTRLLFSMVYMLFTLIALAALVCVLLVGVLVYLPASLVGSVCRLCFHHVWQCEYPWATIRRYLQSILAWDCWLHNFIATREYQITVLFDDDDTAAAPALLQQQRGPHFLIRPKPSDAWSRATCVQIVLYFVLLRPLLSAVAYAWVGLLEDVVNLVHAALGAFLDPPGHTVLVYFFWGSEITCPANGFLCLGLSVLEMYAVVLVRTFLVRGMCACTRAIACESVVLFNV
ncbi:Aste57867_21142 [Aphanomyces stellatus]|uniref:Aste57867_21142 protein n=1 Tax=Aphanomyces stellatus TaxID=120398 RepID=A0A485LGS0_9STRA|nr:hypothetical protein As57867_021074 [Aphanomyces stellatus]VFT97816.1 Aste57867_21142 [Aphanomyces stellatus]